MIIIASISSCVFTINLREILLFAPGLEGKGERKQPVNESIATGTTPRQNTTKDLNGFCVGVLYSCVFLPFVNLREILLLHLALKASESKLTCDACALIIIASISSCVFTINLREILLFAPGLEGKGERKQPVNESIATGTTPRQNTTKDLNGFCVGVLYSCVFLPFVNLRENLLLHLALKASVILLLHLALKARVNTSKP